MSLLLYHFTLKALGNWGKAREDMKVTYWTDKKIIFSTLKLSYRHNRTDIEPNRAVELSELFSLEKHRIQFSRASSKDVNKLGSVARFVAVVLSIWHPLDSKSH
jgi:hypothetical protein